ncbi:MAG: hypothetical protein O7D34_02100, partial [Ignavibacteria bacterium]|nr:hypothetical protein [Ignavibacteria bacterium]
MKSIEAHEGRLYEVTEVKEDTTWFEEPDNFACILGTIVRTSSKFVGDFQIIRAASNGFLSVAAGAGTSIYLGANAILRPLNKRDQEKIMHKW